MLVKQLRTCVAVPAATLRRPLSSPLALPQLGDRCSSRANRLVVAAGPKKKLKQQLQELSQELDRRILELKAAHARETARGLVDAAAAPLGSHGGAGAAPPSLEFGDLAASALELAQQAEEINAATASLLGGLHNFAGRISALSGPVADTGVPSQPLAAAPLLGSTDEPPQPFLPALEPASPIPAAPEPPVSGELPLTPGLQPPAEASLGVTVTSTSPAQDLTNRQPVSRSYPTSIDEVFDRQPADEEELLPFAAQIQAAIDAVDSTDVLIQEINYEAAGERVRQRQRLAQQAQAQQQAIGNGSGPAVVPSAGLVRSAATQAPPATPAAPAAGAPPLAAPFGQSGVSISKNLGKPPSGALSQEQLDALRADIYPNTREDGSVPIPGTWPRPACASQNGTQNGAQNGAAERQQEAAEAEDLTQDQPGDASYLAAVRAAMANLGPPQGSTVAGRAADEAAPMALSPQASEAVAEAAVAAGGGAEAPAENAAKEVPSGPPPVLSIGDDDIFWVNQLQAALLREGCYPGEEEMEDWVFGDGTHSALLTFQAAMIGLEETGTADADTWAALLGPNAQPLAAAEGAAPAASAAAAPAQPAAASAWESLFAEAQEGAGGSSWSDEAAQQPEWQIGSQRPPPAATPFTGEPPTKWPIVRMDDGGRPVHWLQCALENAGCFCGEDDMLWWQFGTPTESALRTFQGMLGLPETGVSDAATWLALLGPNAQPADLMGLSSGDVQYNDDMADHSHDGSIYLVGEQRWSRKTF